MCLKKVRTDDRRGSRDIVSIGATFYLYYYLAAVTALIYGF